VIVIYLLSYMVYPSIIVVSIYLCAHELIHVSIIMMSFYLCVHRVIHE